MKKHEIKINLYEIVSRAVAEGAAYGYRRAFKHTDNPEEGCILDQIHDSVMSNLCEIIDFGDFYAEEKEQ